MALTKVPSQLISSGYLLITPYSGPSVQVSIVNSSISITLNSGSTTLIPVN